ncbi:hypothetical protein [Kribbella pratensis]|uniref:Uncharacterized protein n=1 Tax=Kribbella pratensis TaxID=2512112 RepID=A0A4V3GHR4_9ACTN|nr:hypothetical protein [Kribbella pratensis]TDW77147.1 hypothetical protein EV653_2311 [Kribbella pratensis]
MASPDLILTTSTCDDVTLPINPFVSNRYHFGMLLGVADLDTDQGYHRGKAWLHTAWLHGDGTVWGLQAELRTGTNELAVLPGLAIDERGRELYVADTLCVDLGLWYDANRPEDLVVTDDGNGGVIFELQLTLCAQRCLDRPVPAIAESCEGASGDTAYSRAVEQGLPVLRKRPDPTTRPFYPRVHQLLGLAEATDPLVTQALADIAAADPADRLATSQQKLAAMLAADAIDRRPAAGPGDWFPEPEPGCVVLADLKVHLAPEGTGWRVVEDGADPTVVDNLVRRAVAPTGLLQDLLVPPSGEAARVSGRLAEPGLQLEDSRLSGKTLTLEFSGAVKPATVRPAAFTVTALRPSGWEDVEVTGVQASGSTVQVELGATVRVRPIRVIVEGAGARPVLGADDQLLNGGHDAALMINGA